ncbi:hypothetical protein [Pelagibacterium montanilacus]|uniref:hypothetical protein n=1 Tax=Pelagibacterium montanilacus TaxID=2185280 RepID=UPI000F8E7078|nr:hypothetical protein [Pelagibacterium montanilacus]
MIESLLYRQFPGLNEDSWAILSEILDQSEELDPLHFARIFIDAVGEQHVRLEGLSSESQEKIARYRDELTEKQYFESLCAHWLDEILEYNLFLSELEQEEISNAHDSGEALDYTPVSLDIDSFVPEHDVHISYWAKMPSWTVEEAAAISFDVDPSHLPAADEQSEDEDELSWFLWAHSKRVERIRREQQAQRLPQQLTLPSLARWFQKSGLTLAPKAREWSGREHHDEDDLKPTGQKQTTLDRLLVGMAIMTYGYDPDQKDRSGSYERIASELSEVWESMNIQTVRTHLVAAVDRLEGKQLKPKIPNAAIRRSK